MQPLLDVRNLSVTYLGRDGAEYPALTGISFCIGRGEAVGLLGESGCGKSTTALAVLGLMSGESARVRGSVLFRAQDLLSMSESELRLIRGARISLIFQDAEISLSPMMRVGHQVAEVIRAHRDWDRQQCCEEARAALGRVGLEGERIFHAYPHQLSGGQRQRVVVAQALACEPALLIADEPTASLDARAQADFLALLREMKDQLGISILLISHSPQVLATVAERVLVMHEGHLIEEGTPLEIFLHPSERWTQQLLRAGASRANRRRASDELANAVEP
jgi:ABC-type glutathione transport system ATPase component